MAYTWDPIPEGSVGPDETHMQSLIDAIHSEETRLEFGCDGKQMNPSGRQIQDVASGGQDPARPFNNWLPDMDPTFSREFIEKDSVQRTRDAINNIYEYTIEPGTTCRVHFASDHDSYRAARDDAEDSSYNSGNDNNDTDEAPNLGDFVPNEGQFGNCVNNNDDNQDGTYKNSDNWMDDLQDFQCAW